MTHTENINFLNTQNKDLLIKDAVTHFNNGTYDLAKKNALRLSQEFPENYIGWKILGAIYRITGKLSESLEVTLKTTKLKPDDAEAHNNLGNIYMDLDKILEAKRSYKKAIELSPHNSLFHCNLGHLLHKSKLLEDAIVSYKNAIAINENLFETHNTLGNLYDELGRLEEAEKCYRRAIEISPNFSIGHANIGIVLRKLNKNDEAFDCYEKAITLDSDCLAAYAGLAELFSTQRIIKPSLNLERMIFKLLIKEGSCDPRKISKTVITVLKSNPTIQNALKTYPNCSDREALQIIVSLADTSLLLEFIKRSILPDLELEKLLIFVRRNILINIEKYKENPSVLLVQKALTIHCFINEYIYPLTSNESEQLDNLSVEVANNITKGKQPRSLELACLAGYRRLVEFEWEKRLDESLGREEFLKLQVTDYRKEVSLKQTIHSLTGIAHATSKKVKEQYEKNPYPRWTSLQRPLKPTPFFDIVSQLNLNINSNYFKISKNLRLLIAGCGTGRHAIESALRLRSCEVTAIDLSLSSLAYAKRKAEEYEISNIEFYLADILAMDNLDLEFDIIESVGVLHHLQTPLDGWSTLADRLKTGGVMKIGLYSESARKDIINYRNKLGSLSIGACHENLVFAREEIIKARENFGFIPKINDFYSASEFRDLLLHEQEHQFTIPKIKACISELGLKFCGFESRFIQEKFNKTCGVDSMFDLDAWHVFEKDNPYLFLGMYQFWLQKY